MAKEDFCFTYYDGDAARDTTHMNRLERGAYHDLVLSQRKFGHLSLDQVKKVLGRDFTECWPAIELILKIDDDGKYFIEWLEISILKARRHSKKQKGNVTKRYHKATNSLPKTEVVIPLGDGDGDGNEDGFKIKKESVSKTLDENPWDSPDFTKPDIDGDELIFPVDTGPMRELWASWKRSRWENHRTRYGMMGEQADLKRLEGFDFHRARETILTAIAGKWKNLYPEKSKQNGTSKNKQQRNTSDLIAGFQARYGPDADK